MANTYRDAIYLDLVELAYIRFDVDGRGEMVFGALQAGLECETGVNTISFDFEGSDEMTPIRGTGMAELAEDGSLQVGTASTTTMRSSSSLISGSFQPPVRLRSCDAQTIL